MILVLLKDDFCDEVLEMTNLHEEGTFQKERWNFYSASDLIKTISIFSHIGYPLQIASLLLWITFTSLKTFFWVKAYDFNIYSPDKIRVYILVLSALSSAVSSWDLMVALISTEGAKFSDLSLLTSVRIMGVCHKLLYQSHRGGNGSQLYKARAKKLMSSFQYHSSTASSFSRGKWLFQEAEKAYIPSNSLGNLVMLLGLRGRKTEAKIKSVCHFFYTGANGQMGER